MNKCTACNEDGAYIGSNKVECLNPKCKHFSESWLKEYLKTEVTKHVSDSFYADEKDIDEALKILKNLIDYDIMI